MLSRSCLIAGVFAAFLISGCSSAYDPWRGKTNPVKVVVSFPPLYSFVANVAGDRAGIISLCTTSGPHGYTYRTGDAYALRGADIVFALGLGFDDPFIDRAAVNAGNPRLKGNVIKLGDEIVRGVAEKKLPKPLVLYGVCDHPAHKGHKHEHPEDIDAHMWSGIPQAKIMVEMVRDHLKRIDPEGAEEYDTNATDYLATLEKLREDGRKLLEGKKDRQLVTFHASMGYFANSFDLTILDTIRKIPSDDRSSKEFKELVENCRQAKVRTIAVEPQYPKEGTVHILVRELNKSPSNDPQVSVIELDPLETAPAEDLSAGWYESKMRENLDILKKALP